MKTLTAVVDLGLFPIETQVDPETGIHYVTSVYSNHLLAFESYQTNVTRTLKALLGKDLNLAKVQPVDSYHGRPTTAITLLQFEKLLAFLDRKGNAVAQEIRDALVGLSLHQLSCDAHNIKFEKKQRQAWLEQRLQHKSQFHPLYTSWLASDGVESGLEYAIEVKRLKSAAGLPQVYVGDYSSTDLEALNRAEIRYDCLRSVGLSHAKALTHIRGRS